MAEPTIPEATSTPTPDAAVAAVAPVADAAPVAAVADADPLDAPSILDAGEPAVEPVEAAPVDVVPEAYELVAPEGFALDADSVAAFTPVAKELGLTNDAANKLMPVAAQFAQRITDQANKAVIDAVVQQRADWAKSALADAEIGGSPEQHAEVKAVAAKALDDFGGADFRAFLNETGLGNHPEMIRFIYRAGKAIGEEARVYRADAAAPVKRDAAELLYPNDGPKGG